MLSSFFSWYFSRSALPYWCILLIDSVIIIASGFVSTYLFLGGHGIIENFWIQLMIWIAALPLFMIGMRMFHTYAGIVRYSSFVDLMRVACALIVGVVLTSLVMFILPEDFLHVKIRYRVLALTFLIAMIGMWSVRILAKYIFDTSVKGNATARVYIYGVRQGGASLAKSIRNQHPLRYLIKGFMTEEPSMVGKYLLGTHVYDTSMKTIETMIRQHVTILFVSPLCNERFRDNTELVNALIKADIKIMMMQNAEEWDGKTDLSHAQLQEVDIEDLLPRDKIEVNMDAIGAMLTGKRILITGAAGSIGSEMVRQIAPYHPSDLILVDQAETPMHDIRLWAKRFQEASSGSNRFQKVTQPETNHLEQPETRNLEPSGTLWNQKPETRNLPETQILTIVGSIADKIHMEKIFSEHKPEYVFHAAAYKHVPMMEDNPAMAVRNNINGTRVIADLAVKYGTKKFVMISTDKAVNPTNVMGCSKRICEIYCQSLNQAIQEYNSSNIISDNSRPIHENSRSEIKEKDNSQIRQFGTEKDPSNPLDPCSNNLQQFDGSRPVTQFVTTRFGNVLGSNGSVIPLFRQQIKKGGPVTVTHPDIIRFFMLIPEACKLVLEAGTMGNGGEIFVFDMGKPVKIVDLAKRMIELSGAKDIEIKFTGLRDGEKLYEEVLNDKEGTIPTHHPKIMKAKVREYDYETAKRNEDELLELSKTHDDMLIVKKMKEIVPEFKSRVSKYEVLDK